MQCKSIYLEADGFWWVLEFFVASKNEVPRVFISADTVCLFFEITKKWR